MLEYDMGMFLFQSISFCNFAYCLQWRIASKEKSSVSRLAQFGGSLVQLMSEKSDSTQLVPGITVATPAQHSRSSSRVWKRGREAGNTSYPKIKGLVGVIKRYGKSHRTYGTTTSAVTGGAIARNLDVNH
jgi:hypothetical protein